MLAALDRLLVTHFELAQGQRNFTDPNSHILKGADGWIHGYKAQAAVDGDHQVIVAIGVCYQPSDAVHMFPCWSGTKSTLVSSQITVLHIPSSTAPLPESLRGAGLDAHISSSQQHTARGQDRRGTGNRKTWIPRVG